MNRALALTACLAALASGEVASPDANLASRSPLVAALAPAAGAWSEVPVTNPDRAADRARIAASGKRFLTAISATKDGPSEPARRAVAAVVDALISDAKPSRPDSLDPVFARRAVRGGALRGLGADAAAADLEKAVADAARCLPVAAFSGPQGARLEDRRDAFGAGGWALTGPRTAFAVPHSVPQFAEMPSLSLVVELPDKADPSVDATKAISAAVHADTGIIASWTAKSGGFVADKTTWRAAVPEPRGHGLAAGLLPPHLVLTGLDGDPVRLVALTGSVTPPRSGKPAESDRFITEAAKALPDAQHLDLIGQHLFRYVYDSPDPRFPGVIGSLEIKGDVHQTAAQTLSATTGGQCRGDCDDLAELYQTIAEKQGRLGHLLVLPSHTAFAAARQAGKSWIVEVMQTGPTLAFKAATLPDALRAAHAHFDGTAPFSPDNLGLLLRFSGENTRAPFWLGWRIFAEKEYARVMIDVQRDWQYQTYARAISKMDRLIAAGDRDPANLHELAALYQITGQWSAAAIGYEANLAALTDPVSKIEVQLEYAAVLSRGGKAEAARTVLADLAAQLPQLAPQLGNGIAQLGMRISLAQLAADDVAGGRATLMKTAFGPVSGMIAQVIQMVSQPGFDRNSWSGDGRLAPVRGLIGSYVNCLLAHLAKAGPAAGKDPTLVNARQVVDAWLAKLAFLEADAPADAIDIYAIAARVHALDLTDNGLAQAVETAKPPTDAKHDHLARPFAPAAQARDADLAWIRISPAWWYGEVARALRGGNDDTEQARDGIAHLESDQIDRPRVAAAARGAVAALAACRALGLANQALDRSTHFAVLTAAIVAGDDKALRERLRFVKRENDKRLRDATATTLGSLAPACDDKTWQMVLKAWVDEVDYKPKWFSIAWAAVVAGAPKQALATAKMAASRFKDEPSFSEEVVFMEKLLASEAKPKP
jgi:hypothetical protein